MWYVPEIPTGQNPHWTESPPEFYAVVIPFLGARNPHLTESRLLMYFNLALQRHYEDKLHFNIRSVAKMRILFPIGEVISA